MKLQVTQENLSKALNIVAKIANSRSTLPILSNVLIKTTKSRLSIAATNLDIAITCFIGTKIQKEGQITAPARLLQDFVGSLPNKVIELEVVDSKLNISTEKYKSTINGIVADDFPVIPKITTGQTWNINSQKLKEALQQVIFCATNDEARPVLTGVYFNSGEGKLYIAATDSYRLAEKTLNLTTKDINLLVPAGATQELVRIIGDQDLDIKITNNEQQVQFQVGDTELVARLIEGNYPDYKKLIPGSFSNQVILDKSEFINITRVSSLFARESAGSITVNIDSANKQVEINSLASQIGENSASAGAEITGDGSITLNSRYLLDALNALSGQKAKFCFNGKLEPSVLSDPGAKDYLHVIMPLKS